MPGGCFQGAIFDVDGVLVGSPHEPGEGRLVAFADALRFALAVKQAGVRIAAMSSSRDGAAAAIEAAGARGMATVGVARTGDEETLRRAGADLVVATLDDVSVEALGDGRLQFHSTFAERRRRQRERPPSEWALMSLSAGGSFGDGGVPGCGRRCAGQAEAVRGRLSAFEESLRALRRHASEHRW